jgi:hypothetical protein
MLARAVLLLLSPELGGSQSAAADGISKKLKARLALHFKIVAVANHAAQNS